MSLQKFVMENFNRIQSWTSTSSCGHKKTWLPFIRMHNKALAFLISFLNFQNNLFSNFKTPNKEMETKILNLNNPIDRI